MHSKFHFCGTPPSLVSIWTFEPTLVQRNMHIDTLLYIAVKSSLRCYTSFLKPDPHSSNLRGYLCSFPITRYPLSMENWRKLNLPFTGFSTWYTPPFLGEHLPFGPLSRDHLAKWLPVDIGKFAINFDPISILLLLFLHPILFIP